ncbi:MAG: hypothetical protein KME02_15800 [Aphanothece saxicola GSE-SYN-MK-01-06B]|jgi:hypothetical protein|nr:hypothetical protein [Aphanothece saxicola GSE-SYN-MK-01-06B]
MGPQDEEKELAMAASDRPPSSAGEKPGERVGGWKFQKTPAGLVLGGSFFSPWSNWRAWMVMLAGVLVGQVIGFSPQLFVVIAALCLVCGWLFDR